MEQAVLGVEASLELAAHHPVPPDLAAEERRAPALRKTLLNMAALWPDHADNPRLPAGGKGTGPRLGTVARPAA